MASAPPVAPIAAAARAGRPWATRLPFPVHCLSKVERVDHVTGWKFVNTYAYHHGYFDGDEREFRGFGLVEQSDTEALSAFDDPLRRSPEPAGVCSPEPATEKVGRTA